MIPIELWLVLLILGLSSAEPIFVADCVRHGIHTGRTNLSQVPNITWYMYDELVPSGIRQQHLLGRLRRETYLGPGKLLSEEFDPKVIQVKISNFRRNFMSAQSYLLGLYSYGLEKLNEQQRNLESSLLLPNMHMKVSLGIVKELDGEVAPHSIPIFPMRCLNKSAELFLRIYECPMYDYGIDSYYFSDLYKDLRDKNYSSLWEDIRKVFPLVTDEYIKKFDNAVQLTDFFLSAENGGRRPEQFNDSLIVQLKDFWAATLQGEITYKPILIKISLYKWVEDIFTHMDEVLAKKTELKYVLYSSHSRGIGAFAFGLRQLNDSIKYSRDDFATNMLFQLDEEGTQHNVLVYYNGELVHKQEYGSFKKSFMEVASLGMTREEACKAPDNYTRLGLADHRD